jgi:hypothetical protein
LFVHFRSVHRIPKFLRCPIRSRIRLTLPWRSLQRYSWQSSREIIKEVLFASTYKSFKNNWISIFELVLKHLCFSCLHMVQCSLDNAWSTIMLARVLGLFLFPWFWRHSGFVFCFGLFPFLLFLQLWSVLVRFPHFSLKKIIRTVCEPTAEKHVEKSIPLCRLISGWR